MVRTFTLAIMALIVPVTTSNAALAQQRPFPEPDPERLAWLLDVQVISGFGTCMGMAATAAGGLVARKVRNCLFGALPISKLRENPSAATPPCVAMRARRMATAERPVVVPARQGSSYRYYMTAVDLGLRICRATAMIWEIEGFMPEEELVDYDYCDPENPDVQELGRRITKTLEELENPVYGFGTSQIEDSRRILLALDRVGEELDAIICRVRMRAPR